MRLCWISCTWRPDGGIWCGNQLDVRLAARDMRWHCERWFSLRLLGGAAELFFIDTSPGVLEYRTAPWAGNPGAPAPTFCHLATGCFDVSL